MDGFQLCMVCGEPTRNTTLVCDECYGEYVYGESDDDYEAT